MRNPELWARLSAYSFDGPGSAPFSVKLARAEGWTSTYTVRVIEEYRRFLYLTQISARQITPSQIVDAAWHVHLTFTRDYWEVLCPNVIGAAVHHQPCAGEEEMPRYRDQFAATKVLYEAEFGGEPPADIWGRDDATTQRRRPMLLRDETGGSGESVVIVAAIGCLLLLGTGLEVHWVVYLAIVVVAFGLGTVLNARSRRRRAKRRDERGGYVAFDDHYGNESQNSGRGFWGNDGGDGDAGGCGGCGD